MTNTKYVVLNSAIHLNGAVVEAGEIVELPEKSAEALVNEGHAAEATPDEATETALKGSSGADSTNPPLLPSTGSENDTDEEIEKLRKALDDKYVSRIPELKEHAKEADIQFSHDATKGDVIEAILAAAKGEAILAK